MPNPRGAWERLLGSIALFQRLIYPLKVDFVRRKRKSWQLGDAWFTLVAWQNDSGVGAGTRRRTGGQEE
jgi:hypothetical protein